MHKTNNGAMHTPYKKANQILSYLLHLLQHAQILMRLIEIFLSELLRISPKDNIPHGHEESKYLW
jgi:hypothetical protein